MLSSILYIWQAEGVKPVLKYEDDLKVFRSPTASGSYRLDGFSYDYDRTAALLRIASLQVFWHDKKGDSDFVFITDFIGFRWDIPNTSAYLKGND